MNRLKQGSYFDGQTHIYTYTLNGLPQQIRDARGLTHNAHVLIITGPSYRARGRQTLTQEVTLTATDASSLKP
jgi:hypothetical protein